jgi:BirA family transcriptional regulator, biotin operon repressor / biotin---[acetyl-CoA-carboxylase] ligase
VPLREAYDELPSTQGRAIELARSGAEAGTRVVARRQTQGRGRLDHAWVSPPGGLYLSLVLSSPSPPSPLLPLALASSILERFREQYGIPAALKWPNDLVIAPPGEPARKLGGILVDRVASPTLGDAAVVGVGINVELSRAALPVELADRVASLAEFVRPPPELSELESEISGAVLGAAGAVSTPEGATIARRRCRELLYGVGRWATVDGIRRGKIVGLGDDGELWIEAEAERVAIRAGDLRVEDGR